MQGIGDLGIGWQYASYEQKPRKVFRHMNLRRLRPHLAIAAAATFVLGLSACGADTGSDIGADVDVEADEALVAMLPDDIREAGTLTVGTDASYAPNQFLDEDGSTIIGFDIDVFDAVAAKLGLETQWENADFDTIIVGVDSGRYDLGVSSFTITEARKEQVNMVSYFNAGTQWAVADGNPDELSLDDVCGLTVAVQTGTIQEEEDLPDREDGCSADPIDVLRFTGQDEATAALVSGRVQAMLADSPIIAYAVEQSGGQIEPLGEIYDAAPYGYVIPLDDTDLAEAIVAALESLDADGTYTEILEHWGQTQGAISDFAVNP